MEFLSQEWVGYLLWFAAIMGAVSLGYIAKALERIANILGQINERDHERIVDQRRKQLDEDRYT